MPSTQQLTVDLPSECTAYIGQLVAGGSYASPSDYVCDLVRTDQQARERLDALLLEGLNSGPPVAATKEYWAEQKRKLRARLRQQ